MNSALRNIVAACDEMNGYPTGRILTQPPERGRSPPAARRSVEVMCRIPESLGPLRTGTVRAPAVAASRYALGRQKGKIFIAIHANNRQLFRYVGA